ncbi:hypothetical protein [Natrinema halophilum]|uniref:Uncharacterized protein n=1 Tax=Natrinema halophilum TaxID=1699371 RepID=A0A7D5GTB8_9EURY|nr:hypothetical protein [Natrinema halophilum]QLG50009.1 hypothetical protein HYG82_14665 [Natrinema halophilum]
MVEDDAQVTGIEEVSQVSVSRRRMLQASTTTIGGVGIASNASAHGGSDPCEQVVPDLAIVNRDDQPRSVEVATENDDAAPMHGHRTMRIEPGDTRTIDAISSAVEEDRVHAMVDEDETVVQELAALRPERFRHGIQITIHSGETRVETQHADLPPVEQARMLARCEE